MKTLCSLEKSGIGYQVKQHNVPGKGGGGGGGGKGEVDEETMYKPTGTKNQERPLREG
jgi:hypothetical protein